MPNKKSTSTNGHSISDSKVTRLNFSSAKNDYKTHDRAAIFIEELKDSNQRIHSNK